MCDVLSHRGPDGEGTYINRRIGLAHRRLSIIDLATGDQPMFNEDGKIVIVFNGEIYNYQELRSNLIAKGHVFKTNSDTEAIIHLYEEKGVDCVEDLRGMFAFALYDDRDRSLFLARDRFGIKPLYYCFHDGSLVFASEIKSILQDPAIAREIDLETLSDYFSFLCIPSPKTIFRGIYKLPAAHRMLWKNGSVHIDQYWNLSCIPPLETLSEDEYVEQLSHLLHKVVKDHLISDVPLGAFLSGGVDSSSIVTLMQRVANAPVTTCTIGFSENAFDESHLADEVARVLTTSHYKHVVTPDVINIIDKLIWHFDEPFADSSAIPTYYLSKMTREHVTVALSGDGGDELFAGYVNYSRGSLEDKFRKLPYHLRACLIKPCLAAMSSLTKGRTLLTNILATPDRSFFNKWRYFSESMKFQLFSNDLKKTVGNLDSFGAVEPFFASCSASDSLTRWQYVDLRTYLVDDILTKVDKMSMACSLEVRPPFLDHTLVEFAFSIPSSLKLKGNTSKYILKKMMHKLLPVNLFQRKKQGFIIPLGHWFRDDLKHYVENILFDPITKNRGYFDNKYVEFLWNAHLTNRPGTIDISLHLWALLIFELWHRRFMDCPVCLDSD